MEWPLSQGRTPARGFVIRKNPERPHSVDWQTIVFEVIDMRSFSNLWYWIALAVMWSSASHWVLGVPWDMVGKARKHGGQAMDDLTDLVRINANRLLFIADVSGMVLVVVVSFMLTVLVVLGFVYRVEFAQAVFLLACPMTIVFGLTLRAARSILAQAQDGADVCARLQRHRVTIQAIGMVSIFVTALWGMFQNLSHGIIPN